MKHVYMLIAVFSVILLSCQDNTENVTKSYLVIKDGDSTYVEFEKNDSNVVIRHSIFTKEEFIDIYTDSIIKYCLDSKIYVVQKENNILRKQIEGNWYSSTLLSFYIDNGLSISDTNKLVTSNIGDFQVQSTSRIKREDSYIDYCDYKILNGIIDSNCFRIIDHVPLGFNTEEYKKVPADVYLNNCSYYSSEKIDVVNYLREMNIHDEKRYILVDFFTYWCAPCIKAIPKLNEINEYDNIKVIGIHTSLSEKHRLEKYKKTFKCSYDLYGENAVYYYNNTEIYSWPHYVLLDTLDYQILQSWNGYQENLEESVNNAIALYEK